MGALYLAVHGEKGMEKLCVVKTALPHLLGKGYGQRFRDEASVVVRLSHGNLVTVFDAGQVAGEIFIAMDFVDGKDLRAVWNRCAQRGVAFPIDIAVHVAKELCRGLGYVHAFKQLRLVHRDISPPNVLLSYTGEVKITDFGLAWSTLKLEKTAPGIIFGKVSYMAPEQARAEPLDGRVDIYATGIILWELLTGRQLFPAPQGSGTDDEVLEAVRKPAVVPPSTRASRVPKELDAIVMKALHPDPTQRFQTGEALRAELAAFQGRTNPATDGDHVARFLRGLFGEVIGEERQEREGLMHEAVQMLALPPAPAGSHPRPTGAVPPPPIPTHAGGSMPTAAFSGSMGNDAPSKLVGTLLAGRYLIKRLCGEGGMGRVYEAEHVEIGRRVAVKVLHPVYSKTPEVVERFRREARAASRVGHPNIVDVTDSGTTDDGSFFFVMEFIEGAELGLVIFKEGPLQFPRTMHVAAQMCDALQAAHDAGIIHRDLKPENVLLISREGQPDFVKVLDFGIAKSAEMEETAKNGRRLTRPGVAMGTPEYMAPEQAAGKPADPRSDIYAVGSIMYEMLTGNPPYDGENVMEVLHKKANSAPPSLRKERPDLPEGVIELVERAMARSPSARPQSMGALGAELRALSISLGGETPPPQVLANPRRRESPDGPILAGSVAGGRSNSWLGLPRRTFTWGASLGLVLVAIVIVRASRMREAIGSAPPPGLQAQRSTDSPADPTSGASGAQGQPTVLAPLPVGSGVLAPPVVFGPVEAPRQERLETAEPAVRRVSGMRAPHGGGSGGSGGGISAASERRKVLEEARSLLRAQRFDEARVAFGRLLEKKSAPPAALLGLAQVAFQEHNYPEATKRAQESVKAGVGVEGYVLLGDALYRRNQYAEARKAYLEALKLNPDQKAARNMLTVVERQLQ
jgi:serine/threonine protein kinase